MGDTPELFPFQVAGHGKILQQDSVLLKPTVHYEAEFYEQIGDRIPRLMPFIPKYFGRRVQPDATTDFIVLEDITRGFTKPCVMDIKMGTTLFPDWCPEAKKMQRIEMAAKTTTGSIGIRICGMNIYRPLLSAWEQYKGSYGKSLTPETISQGFRIFFPANSESRLSLIQSVLKQLAELRDILAFQQHYKFYSTSLLLVYDGEFIEAGGKHTCVVKMIDFAQTQLGGERDDGYMLGLRSLESLLCDLGREIE